jgi:DHA1 family multidrug resistance protein-like MFS transporter
MPRWKQTLWIMFFAQFVSATGFSLIFPFLPLYIQSLGTETGISIEFWAGMVFSSQAITMMIASPIWGALADRYGRKLMAERAMFGGSLIILLMAFARSAEELVLLRTVQGLITGTIPAANALVAAVAPRERLGYAMGMLQVGFRSGIAAGPLIGGVLADTFGFRAPFVMTAGLLFIAGGLVLLGVREDFTPPERTPGVRLNLFAGWRHILALPGTALTFGLSFLLWLGQHMVWPIAPLFVAQLMHQSAHVATTTGLIVGLYSATGTASAIYLGRLGDRLSHRRILIGSALVAVLCYLPQSLVTAAWQLLLLQAVTGAAVGGMIPALSALLVQYTRPGEEGNVYGLDSSVTSAARAVAPLVGAGLAIMFGLRGIFLAAGGIFLVITLVASVWLPEIEQQRPGQVAEYKQPGA